MIVQAKKKIPCVKIKGVTVQPMIFGDFELMIGAKKDPKFGSVITFGMGGINIELFKDISVGFPPLNRTLARRMIEKTKVFKFLSEGFRKKPPVNLQLLEETLVNFSHLIIDFPQIKEIDVNPLLVDNEKIIALDARILLDSEELLIKKPHFRHLIIRPYPRKYVTNYLSREKKNVLLRPIKSEDEPSLVQLFKTFSEETNRFRFFQKIKEFTHETVAKYCNIDYDREMTIVAELTEDKESQIIGMVRLIVEPDGESGEIAVVVGDPWQNKGIGSKLFEHIIEISKDMGLKKIFGEILADNTKMIHICYKSGFEVEPLDKEAYLSTLNIEKKN
jgi:acetyltransferase